MRIDAHQHFWQLARGDYGWLTADLAPIYRDFGPADLAPPMQAAGIELSILVQAAPTEAETEYLLDIAACTPSVAGVVGWMDFDAADAPARIAQMAENPLLVGLRPMIQDIADPDWMLSPSVGRALSAMQQAGLVFDALVKPVHLAPLLTLARRHPELSMVIDHCAKPDIAGGGFDAWAEGIAPLAKLANIRVKLSGLLTEAAGDAATVAPYIDHALGLFGPQRTIFGSDWPVLTLAGDYAGWVAMVEAALAKFPAEDRALAMGGNAADIYLRQRGRP